MNRRKFIEWIGQGTLTLGLLPYCTVSGNETVVLNQMPGISPLQPSAEDGLKLIDGLDYNVLIKWQDSLGGEDTFGFNNDFLCFIPLEGRPKEGILWANHEYMDPYFIHGNKKAQSLEHVKMEQYQVGGSLVHVAFDGKQWVVKANSDFNRRITAQTQIPFNWAEPIAGAQVAKGTLGNCAGGLTPWGTVLTCEENYHLFYGDREHNGNEITSSLNGWEIYDAQPPEHFGWVVEVNPLTGEARKHVALGRCFHECATVASLPDGRVVVYTGDDKNDEHLYKFVSSKPNSLEEGTLYVAQTESGQWLSLDIDEQPVLAENFNSQTEVLTYLRKAAKLLGATPLDRPEDIEVDPINGQVLVTLTNNTPKGNYFGSIMKIEEDQGKHDAMTFKSSAFLTGGEDTGFAAPDNMIFDRRGNLWFTSDISGSKMNKPPYDAFKNNGLFVVPREGDQAGQALQVASAPNDAEFTGPWFSPDGKTLFLSVQHPGEMSSRSENWTSNWPDGGSSMPRPAVVTIQGSLLNQIQGIES